MTKKFWNDWKRRVGETEDICVFTPYGYHTWLLGCGSRDKLLKVKFHGDSVDLVIERHNRVFNDDMWNFHDHVENEYKTLHRNDISTVYFKRLGNFI